MSTNAKTDGFLELVPEVMDFLPEEFSFPPLVDPEAQQRFLREMERGAVALKGYYTVLRMASELAREIRKENGGKNRLYIYADRWGVVCIERTPILKRIEGRIEVDNPDFVQAGW